MTLISTWVRHDARSRQTVSPYRCEIARDYATIEHRWRALANRGVALAFQDEPWISTWYKTLGQLPGVEPLPLTIVDTLSGRDVMALPLVMRRSNGLRIIEAADGGMTDYNAPIIGPDAPQDMAGRRILLQTILAQLPQADILRLTKMPLEVDARPNPLAFVPGTVPCRLTGNVLHMPERYEEWHWDLERTFRKELERSLRVFRRSPDAAFRRIEDPVEAAHVYGELKRLQAERIRDLGLHYALGEPHNVAFYDQLVATGLKDGSVVLTALLNGSEVVAALLGIRSGKHYAMVRLGVAGGHWKICSPGRLVIERTMQHLHAQGLRSFDFTIGDYDYKRRLGVTPLPLVDFSRALSWRGIAPVALERLRAFARTNPLIQRLRQRLAAI